MDDTRLPSIETNDPPMSSRKFAVNRRGEVLALARFEAVMTDT
jgi:hypothetical protein